MIGVFAVWGSRLYAFGYLDLNDAVLYRLSYVSDQVRAFAIDNLEHSLTRLETSPEMNWHRSHDSEPAYFLRLKASHRY